MAAPLTITDEESSGFNAALREPHKFQAHTLRCRKRVSPPETGFWIIISCLVATCLGRLIWYFVSKARWYSQQSQSSKLCTTPACRRHAELLRTSLALNYTQLDPCTDFSAYACDGWRQNHPLHHHEPSISTIDIVGNYNAQILRAMLEGHPGDGRVSLSRALSINGTEENIQKMRKIYQVCMDETRLEDIGMQPLQEMLRDFDKQFPSLADENKISRTELTQVLIWLAKKGVRPLVDFMLAQNETNPEQTILTIVPPTDSAMLSILPPSNIDVDEREVQALINLFSLVESGISTQGISSSRGDLRIDAQGTRDTLEFFRLIQKASSTEMPIKDKHTDMLVPARRTTSVVPVDELDEAIEPFSVRDFFEALIPANLEPTMIQDGAPGYFDTVSKLIPSLGRNTIINAGRMAIMEQWMPYIQPEVARRAVALISMSTGIDLRSNPDRSQVCANEVDAAMGLSIGSLFQHYATDKDDILKLRHMVDSILDEFSKERLETLDWLDGESKASARAKVANMRVLLGWSFSGTKLDEEYSDLNVTDDFFETHRNWVTWELDHAFDALSPLVSADKGRTVQHYLDHMTAPVVNAFYAAQQNLIGITPGIAQFPSCDDHVPEYITYGRLGFFIGHELTHGFDNKGRHFDKYGVRNEWMRRQSALRFTEKAACFIEQFSRQTIVGKSGAREMVNGSYTLGENIADAGGINTAFSAWNRRAEADHLRNQALPGLENFSRDQLFFLNYANTFCSNDTPESLSLQLWTNEHSPNHLRINTNLENSRAFKEAFECEVKEPTCELW